MKQLLKKISLTLAVLAFVPAGVMAFSPALVSASPATDQICDGVEATGAKCDTTSGADVNKLVKEIISVLSFAVGAVAVIMIIIAGLTFVTAGGDASRVGRARMTLIYALVGLVVAAMAQVLVRFVLGKVG